MYAYLQFHRIWGHSTTTWTNFDPILTSSPPRVDKRGHSTYPPPVHVDKRGKKSPPPIKYSIKINVMYFYIKQTQPEEWATTKCHIVQFCNKHWNKINEKIFELFTMLFLMASCSHRPNFHITIKTAHLVRPMF